jgi:anaerobic magnesium-protoporphyrin IX monomethyl ester cyclase
MKKAGCYLLGLGIESGVQAILDNAKKKQTTAQAERAVALCKKVGIKTMGHFIFGLPGESKATANKTIKFMSKLGLDYMQCYCAVPYPKTELGELAKKNNWIRAEKWSQYDFGGESILHTDTIVPEDVSYFRKKAFRHFYLTPHFILRTLKDIKLTRVFNLLKFAKWMSTKN